MANDFTVTKIAWGNIRDVATGYRTNKQLTPILKDLGLTTKGVA